MGGAIDGYKLTFAVGFSIDGGFTRARLICIIYHSPGLGCRYIRYGIVFKIAF